MERNYLESIERNYIKVTEMELSQIEKEEFMFCSMKLEFFLENFGFQFDMELRETL